MGTYALHRQDFSAALDLSQRVLAAAEDQGVTLFTPDFYYLQAQALVALNRPDEARSTLQQALSLLRSHQHRWCFLQIVKFLANLEEQSGNDTVAADLRHEARLTLEFIIDHIPEGGLRASFVGLPEVKQLLST